MSERASERASERVIESVRITEPLRPLDQGVCPVIDPAK